MYNYMRELQQTFFEEPDCADLRGEIQELQQRIRQQLSDEGRKELLCLIDKTAELEDRISFANFLSGFRLASSISAELGQTPAFSFARQEELRASQNLRDGKHQIP